MKNIIFTIGGLVVLTALIFIVVTALRIKEASVDFSLSDNFTLMFGTKGKIEDFDANAFAQTSLDGFSLHRGWFYPSRKTAVIYSLKPNSVTAADIALLPDLFIKACNGVLESADTKRLSPEAQNTLGVLFHELIAHGSDEFCRGKPLTMIHHLWPNTPDPGDEKPQNPWKIVRKYWASDATHPLFETADYSAP